MRIDRDFRVFATHPEWSTYKNGVGYVPTEKAPREAVEAMRRYNKRNVGVPASQYRGK